MDAKKIFLCVICQKTCPKWQQMHNAAHCKNCDDWLNNGSSKHLTQDFVDFWTSPYFIPRNLDENKK